MQYRAFAVGCVIACACSATPAGPTQGRAATGAGGLAGAPVVVASGGSSAGNGSVIAVGGLAGAAPNAPNAPPNWPPPSPDWVDDGGTKAVFADGLTAADASKFGTPMGDGGLSIAYPLDQSLHPANMGKITFQWTGGANQLFRIEATVGTQIFRFYGHCQQLQGGCSFTLPSEYWVDLGVQSAGQPVSITVSGTTDSGPTQRSAPITVQFTKNPLQGAVYYWSVIEEAVMRANMDSTEPAVPFIAPRSTTNQYGCTGCHTVSRKGDVIGFNVQGTNPGGEGEGPMGIQTASVADPTMKYVEPTPTAQMQPSDHQGFFPALNPDGTVVAVTRNDYTVEPPGRLELWDAHDGHVLDIASQGDARFGGTGIIGMHPEWSPDGSSLAVALADRSTGCSPEVFMTCKGGVGIVPFAGSTLGTATRVAHTEDSSYLFYPTWGPDGDLLAFARAPGGHSNDPTGDITIHVIKLDGTDHVCPGPTCYELTRGQHGPTATWPKFTPFSVDAGKYVFLSISSNSDYGYASYGKTMLWMFGIDVAKLGSGDASFAPVWLPQQPDADRSLQAIWTEKLPCNATDGCVGCVPGLEECIVTETECSCRALPPPK